MNKLLETLKKDFIVRRIETSMDDTIILLNKNTGAYVGSFKIDNNKKLIYNTDLRNLTAYEIMWVGQYFVEYSNL